MKNRAKNKERQSDEYWEKIHQYGRQYSSFDWPSVELVLNLVSTYSVLSGKIASKLSDYGLSRAGFNVLMILIRSKGKVCKHYDLSKLMLVSRANITGLIDRLVSKALVTREHASRDRRVWLVRITSRGENLLRKILPGYYSYIRQLCADIPGPVKKKTTRLLFDWRKFLNENKKI